MLFSRFLEISQQKFKMAKYLWGSKLLLCKSSCFLTCVCTPLY